VPTSGPDHPHAVIELRGQLAVEDAAALAVALSAAVAREPVIILDLTPERREGSDPLPGWVMTWDLDRESRPPR
jgi:hypothetical protein